jgi:hypothetical protein
MGLGGDHDRGLLPADSSGDIRSNGCYELRVVLVEQHDVIAIGNHVVSCINRH